MRPVIRTIIASLAIGLSLSLVSPQAIAKDAHGLDEFKLPVEKLTKSDSRFVTKFGNNINVYSFGSADSANPRFLVQGGLHGNELLGSEFVVWLAKRFAAGESLLNTLNRGKVSFDFVPYANPDGTIQFTRYNGNKINLNRNFGTLWGVTRENPGATPFSEVETKAIQRLLQSRDYTGTIDVHGYTNWVVIPTSPRDEAHGSKLTATSRFKLYDQWAAFIQKETASRLPGYEVKTAGGLGDGGAFEDYAFWGAGTPSACLELFSSDRFIPASIAAKIVDLLTPKVFSAARSMTQNSDMFPIYENYVHSLLKEALRLKSGKNDEGQIVSASSP
jgi:hypothetical protein